ncbi:hypothetical protein Tco_1458766 [Tanacetum coccineum]
MNFFKSTIVTRVANFDDNICGFKFEPFANFSARKFSETEVVDVIGTVVSISDCIPFNSYRVDKIRRTLILEDYEEMTPEEFFRGAIKKMVGLIREAEKGINLSYIFMDFIVFCMQRFTKYTASIDGRISPVRSMVESLNKLMVKELTYRIARSTKESLLLVLESEYDDYFPVEQNWIVRKKLLFHFQYSDYNINNNHHVYQLQKISEDETMINMFKKDFYVQDVVDDIQTLLLNSTKSNKFSSADSIPFNIQDTPNSA